MGELTISLVRPHLNQRKILENRRRFNLVKTGRRFGKTELVKILTSYALQGKFIGVWFPTYKDLSEIWREIVFTFFPAILKKNEQLNQILFINGGIIDFWSMDDPDSGRGRKYHRVIMDEFAKAKKNKEAWQGTIRATLTDYKGDAWFFSTPKGKGNYFYELQQKAKDDPKWAYFKFTSYDNPYLDPKEIDGAKSELEQIYFDQEYMAEDIDINDKPFMYAFSIQKHVIKSYTPNPHLPLLVSFDFNVDPMTCTISQQPDIKTVRIFDEIIIPNSSTPELCDAIISKYPQWVGKFEVTGDATGSNRSSFERGGVTHYIKIKDMLEVKDFQLKLRKHNPSHLNSRILCNSVLQNADFAITENCKGCIEDASQSGVDSFGQIIKTKDKGRHLLDNIRYTIDASYPDFIKDYHLYS